MAELSYGKDERPALPLNRWSYGGLGRVWGWAWHRSMCQLDCGLNGVEPRRGGHLPRAWAGHPAPQDLGGRASPLEGSLQEERLCGTWQAAVYFVRKLPWLMV